MRLFQRQAGARGEICRSSSWRTEKFRIIRAFIVSQIIREASEKRPWHELSSTTKLKDHRAFSIKLARYTSPALKAELAVCPILPLGGLLNITAASHEYFGQSAVHRSAFVIHFRTLDQNPHADHRPPRATT